MRSWLVPLLISFVCLSEAYPAESTSNREFVGKLQKMLKRVERSIELSRKQIVQNQNAPFLADLYVQLADMLVTKSNVLYYLGKEFDKNSSKSSKIDKNYSPVVRAQKEAIDIYMKVIEEFPNYQKRARTLFKAATALKAIDEKAKFLAVSEKVIREFPKSEESIKTQLLVGLFYFENTDFESAKQPLERVISSKLPYERNSARHKLGIIAYSDKKFEQSLIYFADIAKDTELTDEDNPLEVDLERRTVGSNLKKEALIDSIRSYTSFFKKDPKPVKYYSEIAPTELIFQETMEKLAFRYIYLKKYQMAVKLLRVIAERTMAPQKVVNIYREVLEAIPIRERASIPIGEIKLVLDKFKMWISYFNMPSKTKRDAEKFFELQVRELATRNHTLGKKKSNPDKITHLKNAQEYYQLYLSFFRKSKYRKKVAINLADVSYRLKEYSKSGDQYIRIFEGEFGKPKVKKKLIRNSILALQKNKEEDYYTQLRVRGLLLRSINHYMDFDPKQKRNSRLRFYKVKIEYEQGLYETAIPNLAEFIRQFKKSKYVIPAAEMIMDYFNIRGDYSGLAKWSKKLLSLGVADPKFRNRLKRVRKQALLKKLDEKVKGSDGYKEFDQSKKYLDVAMTIGNRSLRNVAMKQALGRARSEKDYKTFFKAAEEIAKREKDPEQRAKILLSSAEEKIGLARYQDASRSLSKIYQSRSYPVSERLEAFKKSVQLSVMLRDVSSWKKIVNNPLWAKIDAESKGILKSQVIELIQSPTRVPRELTSVLLKDDSDDKILLALYKYRSHLPQVQKRKLGGKVNQYCNGNLESAVCKWKEAVNLDKERKGFIRHVSQNRPKLKMIEVAASKMSQLLNSYATLATSGDPQLDILLSMRNAEILEKFAVFLKRVSKRNKDIKSALIGKVKESLQSSRKHKNNCKTIIEKSELVSPANRLCSSGQYRSAGAYLSWSSLKEARRMPSSVVEPPVALQKQVFADKDNSEESYLKIAMHFYKKSSFNQASAAAVFGLNNYPNRAQDFSAILACSVMKLGFFGEAKYHLDRSSNFKGLKSKCNRELKKKISD